MHKLLASYKHVHREVFTMNKKISQPRWKMPEYKQRQINDAGDIVRNININAPEQQEALQIIDNWRAAHAYPLHVFYMNLRRMALNHKDKDIIVVERLKRIKSILAKLQREKKMLLVRMQDLGGCRMILPTLQDVYDYSSTFQNSRIRHILKKTNDYIQNPKESGYRSLHLIYKFQTDTPEKEIFNQYNMLIEIQFRTHLQHIWATAVEAIGIFTNQALKSGQGDESIKRFFVLVSSIFAIKEKCPIIPNTRGNKAALIEEIKKINQTHHILDQLRALKTIINVEEDNISDKHGYYILQLNYESHMLKKLFFKPSEIELASRLYDHLEQQKANSLIDTVLIRASSLGTVKKAYPNYFLDITEFVNIVSKYI